MNRKGRSQRGSAWRGNGWLLIAMMGLVAACSVNPTPYQPLDSKGGYEETRLQERVYRVSFRANQYTPEQRVIDYLFLRSAELTQQSGYPYFVVEERHSGAAPSASGGGPRVGLGFGFGTSSGNTFLGFGFGTSTQGDSGSAYLATMRIRMLTAEEAKGRDDTYRATEVIANLRPKVTANPPKSS